MSRETISVIEYEKISIGPKRDAARKVVSHQDAIKLLSLTCSGQQIFSESKGKLIAQQMVGVVDLPGLSIEILPKVADVFSVADSRAVLLRMLRIAYGTSFADNSLQSSVAFERFGLKELIIGAFGQALESYLSLGLYKTYQKTQKLSNSVKGNLQITKTLVKQKTNLPIKFYCKFSRFTEDNPINLVIKSAAELMRQDTNSNRHKVLLGQCLDQMLETSTRRDQSLLKIEPAFNQLNYHALPAFSLAKLYLKGKFSTISLGQKTVTSLLFDVNKLFEVFAYRITRRAFTGEGETFYQYQKHYLLVDGAGNSAIQMRPDIVLFRPGIGKTILDSKWKIFNGTPSVADAYQMNAYATTKLGAKNIVLLYPKTHSSQNTIAYSFNHADGQTKKLYVCFIDLLKLKDYRNFLTAYHSMLACIQ